MQEALQLAEADASLTLPSGVRAVIDAARIFASIALVALILLQGPKGEGIASALSESQIGTCLNFTES